MDESSFFRYFGLCPRIQREKQTSSNCFNIIASKFKNNLPIKGGI